MSDAATIAIPLGGSCAASFVLRCAYSSAEMPGVTTLLCVNRRTLFRESRSNQSHLHQLRADAGGSHGAAVQNEAQKREQRMIGGEVGRCSEEDDDDGALAAD
jgi:hypothetical protein